MGGCSELRLPPLDGMAVRRLEQRDMDEMKKLHEDWFPIRCVLEPRVLPRHYLGTQVCMYVCVCVCVYVYVCLCPCVCTV